jgi:predicted nucleic acid-binding protein
VLQEFFVTVTGKIRRPLSRHRALEIMDDLAQWPLLTTDYSLIREAVLLAGDVKLSFWDALIIAAAARSGASRLYTEDLSHGQTVLGVEVVNPFIDLAEDETQG